MHHLNSFLQRCVLTLLLTLASAQAAEVYAPPHASGAIVTITIRPTQPLMTIPPRFYGINIHPGSSEYELARPELLQTLNPDTVRIMTRTRVDWIPGVGRRDHPLSPTPGVFEWSRLDTLIERIADTGAEPYLALGAGPPHWLTNSSNPNTTLPPRPDAIDDYADHMAKIVARYASGATPLVRAVSIENEPENVRYPIEQYIQLLRLAKARIRARAPGVSIGGPTIGYTQWNQPDGLALGFYDSFARMKAAHAPVDFIDWHVYSTNPETVLNTVSAVKKAYGPDLPLVISELNRDWRYSGTGFAESKHNNTGWESVAWFAYLCDKLQRAGVDRVYYFGWRENALGLLDGELNTVRPNYYLLWALTNHLGRKRIFATASEGSVGSIATLKDGKLAMLVYNRTRQDVYIRLTGVSGKTWLKAEFSQRWFELNQDIRAGLMTPHFNPLTDVIGNSTKLPAGGFIVLKEK